MNKTAKTKQIKEDKKKKEKFVDFGLCFNVELSSVLLVAVCRFCSFFLLPPLSSLTLTSFADYFPFLLFLLLLLLPFSLPTFSTVWETGKEKSLKKQKFTECGGEGRESVYC